MGNGLRAMLGYYSQIKEMDTKIAAYPTCWKQIAGRGAYKIHMDESHCTSIAAEADGPQNETLMKMARRLK